MSEHVSSPKGRLEVVCGSMFSGKTEELIRRLKRAHIARKNTIAFKHCFDDRFSTEFIASHAGNQIKAISINTPSAIFELITPETEVIGIDEAQFFSHELINVICDLIDTGKTVIISGLNLDFRSIPFGPMPTLMALADTVTKLSAICIICGQEAFFTQRIVNGKPAKYDEPLIKVGAQEDYQARCRNCYIIDNQRPWQQKTV